MKRNLLVALIAMACFSVNSAFAVSLTIVNQTGESLEGLFVSPTGKDSWGPDQLGKKEVKDGESFKLTGIDKGMYDFKFVVDGKPCVLAKVDFSASETFEMTKEIWQGCHEATKAAAEEAEEGDDEGEGEDEE